MWHAHTYGACFVVFAERRGLVKVNVNGEATDVQEGTTILAFIEGKGIRPGTVVVEYNLEIAPRETWGSVKLAVEDQLQIVSFVGGG
ncbi:MAG TPA: sulfur carrier protein ThiS [Negativicutes bacterium]|nr:sulfur carrier protein ThiS [Negativicutes bacterium]